MTDTRIFVFGSNLAGRHGAGAALYAYRNHDATSQTAARFGLSTRQVRNIINPPQAKRNNPG